MLVHIEIVHIVSLYGDSTLVRGLNYFSGGQILLGVKNASIRGQKNFK